MGRVLKICAAVMGVLLVVMTAGLWIQRQNDPPELSLIYWQNGNSGDFSYTQLIENRLVAKSPFPQWARFAGASVDGAWLYFTEQYGMGDGSDGQLNLYRMRQDQSYQQLVVGGIEEFRWTPDHRYLLFIENVGRDRLLYRIQADGSGRLQLPVEAGLSVSNWFYLNDGRHLYVNVFNWDDARRLTTKIYYMALDGSDFHIVAEGLSLRGVTSDEKWLLVNANSTPYRMRPDGSDLFQLYEPAFGEHGYSTMALLLTDEVVLLRGEPPTDYRVLRLTDGQVLWSGEDNGFLRAETGAEWVYDWDFDDKAKEMTLRAFRANGSEERKIVEPPDNFNRSIFWTPDYQWVYFHRENRLMRARPDLSQEQVIGDGEFAGLSIDDKQVYFITYADTTYRLYRANLDGTHRQLITELAATRFPYDTFTSIRIIETPFVDSRWHTKLLLGAGVTLGVAGVMKNNLRRQITQKRPSPAE